MKITTSYLNEENKTTSTEIRKEHFMNQFNSFSSEKTVEASTEEKILKDEGSNPASEPNQRTAEQKNKPSGFQTISAIDLQNKEFEYAPPIVENLLSPGLALLAGPPKYGKSWLTLDLCLAVATGMPFLGHKAVRASVLYLALEDSENRLRDRMDILLQNEEAPRNLHYAVHADTINKKLFDDLDEYLAAYPDTKLIVIDTFQMIRASGTSKSLYAQDYQDAQRLKEFADKHRICLLLVHHSRKMVDEEDPFNNISGTNGILGAADIAMVMSKDNRYGDTTKLSITGRDIESREIMLSFDPNTCRWTVFGDAKEIEAQKKRETYSHSPIVCTIRKLLTDSPTGWRGTVGDLLKMCIEYAGAKPAANENALSRKLKSMADDFLEYDNIVYEPSRHASNGKRYIFFYQKIEDVATGPS